jgi:hypothetical protein
LSSKSLKLTSRDTFLEPSAKVRRPPTRECVQFAAIRREHFGRDRLNAEILSAALINDQPARQGSGQRLIDFLASLAWPLNARVKGEFDSNPARLTHDEMDLRPLTRELWDEFHNNARPAGNAFIQGIQSCAIGDREGEMMKADVPAPVESDSSVRCLDPP